MVNVSKRTFQILGLTLISVFLLAGCSVQKMAVKQTGGIIEGGLPVFYEEDDLEIAQTALASNIKLLETLLATAPNDRRLLLATAQALTAYAFGFVEVDYERYQFSDPERSDLAKERARNLYMRAREYAKRALATKNKKLAASLEKPLSEFDPLLQKVKSKKYVPILFWLGFSWGSYINLNRESLTAVADLIKVEHIMKKVVELDETYFFGGPHLFLGSYYGSRSRMFGGDPDKSLFHFNRVGEITGGKLLLGKVMHGQHLSVQLQDRATFDRLMDEVLEADDDLLPEQNLMNQIAKVRAEILKKNAPDLF